MPSHLSNHLAIIYLTILSAEQCHARPLCTMHAVAAGGVDNPSCHCRRHSAPAIAIITTSTSAL